LGHPERVGASELPPICGPKQGRVTSPPKIHQPSQKSRRSWKKNWVWTLIFNRFRGLEDFCDQYLVEMREPANVDQFLQEMNQMRLRKGKA